MPEKKIPTLDEVKALLWDCAQKVIKGEMDHGVARGVQANCAQIMEVIRMENLQKEKEAARAK